MWKQNKKYYIIEGQKLKVPISSSFGYYFNPWVVLIFNVCHHNSNFEFVVSEKESFSDPARVAVQSSVGLQNLNSGDS